MHPSLLSDSAVASGAAASGRPGEAFPEGKFEALPAGWLLASGHSASADRTPPHHNTVWA